MLSLLRRLATPPYPIDLDELRRDLAEWSMPGRPNHRLAFDLTADDGRSGHKDPA